MLRIMTLLLALLLSLPVMAQTRTDEAANALFVEAVQLWNRAESEPVTERSATLQRVQSNLKTIIERHPGSALAVRLVIGETVGALSVAWVEGAISEAQDRAAAANEAAGVGRVFRDCPECPEMVVIPAGKTRLGSGRDVTITTAFAVGKFEVTFAEWDVCVGVGGCMHRPSDNGWGRGRQPVMNVNWDDAQQYVAWLSRRTEKAYRLLSEAEWEYAAQAAATTRQYSPVRIRRTASAAVAVGTTSRRRQLEALRRTHSACTTCWAMCGSGSSIAGTKAMPGLRLTVARG